MCDVPRWGEKQDNSCPLALILRRSLMLLSIWYASHRTEALVTIVSIIIVKAFVMSCGGVRKR